MPIAKTDVIWINGSFIPWDDAKVNIMTHALHYGSSWFEGIRVYNTKKGPAVFRLKPHLKRLINSAKMFRAVSPYGPEELEKATLETIKRNKMQECYIRPLIYRGYGDIGVNPLNNPVDVMISVFVWGAYLGKDALEKGADVCVSSWRRAAPDTFPTMAKASGNYLNSSLIKMEAIMNGYVEGIALDSFGLVSEGSGENLFLVYEGKLYTTPFASAILPGITRATVVQLAKDLGYEVVETMIPREWLYIADEVFFTGTAAEITPIRSVDKIAVGEGKPGPITLSLHNAFQDVVRNANDKYGWLTYIS